tara:strand:+ start:253 stop:705 length:453 start_codon:yes stop_codon:yes gene_type:complete
MATTFGGLRTGGLAPENFLGNRPDFSKLGTAVSMANGLVDIASQKAENDIAVGKLNADTDATQFLMNDMAKQAAQDVIDEDQGMRDLIGTGLNIASMLAGAPGIGGSGDATSVSAGLGDGFNIGQGQAGLDPSVDLDRFLTSSPFTSITA